jgi:MFS family permease
MAAGGSWRKVRDTTRRATHTAGSAAHSAGTAARPVARAGTSAARWVGRAIHRSTHASGAGRTGLADLIELTAVSSAGDAFIAVSLAGTLFFHASLAAARGQVALYLLVTMAPFAVLAPLIGPMLDRMRQGRRFILAGTMLGRGLLCWGMAGAILHRDPLTFLPSAFGVLVLSKAYGITRSAVTPRLLPAEITLVTANARCGLGALLAATVAAPAAVAIGTVIHADWVLRIGTLIFLAGTALSLRLPEHVDSTEPRVARVPGDRRDRATRLSTGAAGAVTAIPDPGAGPAARGHQPRPDSETRRPGRDATRQRPPAGSECTNRRAAASTRGRAHGQFGPVVSEALRANAAIRAFSGFMVLFLAFLLRADHFHGVRQNVALGALVAAAAVGGLAGTATGSTLRSRLPHLIMFGTIAVSMLVTAVSAWFFGLAAALLVVLVAAFGQALAKLSLDSIVQREVGEDMRSSTLAVSETLHQLSWVTGGLAGVLLSVTKSGVLGMSVAAAGLGAALVVLVAGRRRRKRMAGLVTVPLTPATDPQRG